MTNDERSQDSAQIHPGIKARHDRNVHHEAVCRNLWLHWWETTPGSPESLLLRAFCHRSNPFHQWDEEPLKQNKKVSSVTSIFSKLFCIFMWWDLSKPFRCTHCLSIWKYHTLQPVCLQLLPFAPVWISAGFCLLPTLIHFGISQS